MKTVPFCNFHHKHTCINFHTTPIIFQSNQISQLHYFSVSRKNKMLGKKLSLKKLAKIVKVVGGFDGDQGLLREFCKENSNNSTPTGFFAVYVGEERQRFVVPTSYLSHPLFKILLDKSQEEFGFEQKNGIGVPCSVSTFEEVLNALECCNGKFDFGNLGHDFV